MFKKSFPVLIAATVLAVLVSCGQPSTPVNRLYIYNWSYYIPEQVLRDFENRFKVTIVYDVYSSNEEMYARLKAGGKTCDLVFPSGDYVAIMVRQNMAERIDPKKVPNSKYLDPEITRKITYDPGMKYSVPFAVGGSGIAVNKKHVKDYAKDYSIFERTDLKGRMLLLEDMREVMGSALRMLGYSANTRNEKELLQAGDLVRKWKKNIMKFDAVNFARTFASGEAWVAQGYLENFRLEMDDHMRRNFDLFIPKKGGTMYIDNMMVLKDSIHKELAFAFMNYIHEPDVYARIADFLMLPSLNTAARKLTTNRTLYDIRDLDNCEIKNDVGPALEMYNRIWQEILIGN